MLLMFAVHEVEWTEKQPFMPSPPQKMTVLLTHIPPRSSQQSEPLKLPKGPPTPQDDKKTAATVKTISGAPITEIALKELLAASESFSHYENTYIPQL